MWSDKGVKLGELRKEKAERGKTSLGYIDPQYRLLKKIHGGEIRQDQVNQKNSSQKTSV